MAYMKALEETDLLCKKDYYTSFFTNFNNCAWVEMWDYYKNETEEVREKIDKLIIEQFQLDQESEHPSLLSTWLLSKTEDSIVYQQHFANILFPLTQGENNKLIQYNKTIQYLNTINEKNRFMNGMNIVYSS